MVILPENPEKSSPPPVRVTETRPPPPPSLGEAPPPPLGTPPSALIVPEPEIEELVIFTEPPAPQGLAPQPDVPSALHVPLTVKSPVTIRDTAPPPGLPEAPPLPRLVGFVIEP